MSKQESDTNSTQAAKALFDRRRFLGKAGVAGLGVAASGLALGSGKSAFAATATATPSGDSAKQIVTAVLIAEDLASTFYYNGLVGKVIQDPNLAGPGGTATNVKASGNAGNVAYLRAALSEEIAHADLARSLLRIPQPSGDPVQTFYLPAGTFDTVTAFTGVLDALENAFIGAYLNAIQEFSIMAALGGEQGGTYTDVDGEKYSSRQLIYVAKIAASIMGVESEHRVLGRVISNTNPANNLAYEQLDGLNAVYNGPKSAVAALTPFLTPSTGPGYSLVKALANQGSVSLPVMTDLPTYP